MKNILYHGSKFDNQGKPLIPGYYHTGEEVIWDGGFESNRFLYATKIAASAVLLGIGSYAEKEFGSVGFRFNEDNPTEAIFFFKKGELLSPDEVKKKLKGVSVFFYAISMKPEHGWVENKNPVNDTDTEFKTNHAIPKKDYVCSEIRVLEWLDKKKIEIMTTTK